MTTIRADEILHVRISGSCLQSWPCQHGVLIQVKDRAERFKGTVGGRSLVRLMSMAKKGRVEGCRLNHFLDLKDDEPLHRLHRDQEPIRVGDLTILYPTHYTPKKIVIKAPPPPKPKKKSKVQEYLNSHGFAGFHDFTMADAKKLVFATKGYM